MGSSSICITCTGRDPKGGHRRNRGRYGRFGSARKKWSTWAFSEVSPEILPCPSRTPGTSNRISVVESWTGGGPVDTCQELGLFVAYSPLGRAFNRGQKSRTIWKKAILDWTIRALQRKPWNKNLEVCSGGRSNCPKARARHKPKLALAWILGRNDSIMAIPEPERFTAWRKTWGSESRRTADDLATMEAHLPSTTVGNRYWKIKWVNKTDKEPKCLEPFKKDRVALVWWLRDFAWDLCPEANELIYDNYNAIAFGWSPLKKVSHTVCSIAIMRSSKTFTLDFIGEETKRPQKKLLLGKGNQYRYLLVKNEANFQSLRNRTGERSLREFPFKSKGQKPFSQRTDLVKSISEKKQRWNQCFHHEPYWTPCHFPEPPWWNPQHRVGGNVLCNKQCKSHPRTGRPPELQKLQNDCIKGLVWNRERAPCDCRTRFSISGLAVAQEQLTLMGRDDCLDAITD